MVAMKEEVNSKKDGRVKSMVGKIEQDKAAASKTTPVAQADISVKKDPAHRQKLPPNLTHFQREMKDLK
ncbi:MAG: hypothetical protein ACR5LB_04690 [Wolbachia sp.]